MLFFYITKDQNIFYSYIIFKDSVMSFQNSYGPDGSININVVPSFGRIVQVPEHQKTVTVIFHLILGF